MNIAQRAILSLCWQEEQHDEHEPRPWLRWLLTHVPGISNIPPRKSEKSQIAKEQWLALRKEEALRIDPERAEVFWWYGEVLDPYGVHDLPEKYRCIGRNYFARSPGIEIVSFDDLPEAVLDRLQARIDAGDFNHADSVPF
jgi:hypothetical protein